MSAVGSPAPSEGESKRSEVNYRFCQECSNLLYPKEDRETSVLLYVCKACHHVEKHDSACTYRNQLGATVTETAGVTTDVANDPTVGTTVDLPSFCTMCGEQLRCIECGEPSAEEFESSDGLEPDELPRTTQRCPKCRGTDAVYFQSQQRAADTGMKLYYVCTDCNHVYTVV